MIESYYFEGKIDFNLISFIVLLYSFMIWKALIV